MRDDPQIDGLQAKVVHLDFDPYDQPPGRFLSADEAWAAARAGEVDPNRFGIFDMWGLPFIAGNVLSDFACLNKVELLPWDSWGMMTGPHHPLDDHALAVIDEVAALATSDDTAAIRGAVRVRRGPAGAGRHHELPGRPRGRRPPRPLSRATSAWRGWRRPTW